MKNYVTSNLIQVTPQAYKLAVRVDDKVFMVARPGDVDVRETTATSEDVIRGKTFFGSNGQLVSGAIQYLDSDSYMPTTSDQIISKGYYINGGQVIKGDINLVPQNIVQGAVIFNVVGTASAGSGFKLGYVNCSGQFQPAAISGGTVIQYGEASSVTYIELPLIHLQCSDSESTSQSASESASQSTSQSGSQSTSESTSQSTSESASQSTSQSTSESTSQSTSESASQSTSQSTSQSGSWSESQSLSESISESGSDQVLLFSGDQLISSATKMTAKDVGSQDKMLVYSGGQANNNHVYSFGSLVVYDGGKATGNQAELHGSIIISSGGSAVSNMINSYGSLVAAPGGSATDNKLQADSAYMYVYGDENGRGQATDTIISASGASMMVGSSGTAIRTSIQRGSLHLNAGGFAYSTFNSGNMIVAGGQAYSTFNSGSMSVIGPVSIGQLPLLGYAFYTVVEGGRLLVEGFDLGSNIGALISSTIIGQDGIVQVSNASAKTIDVNAGGTLQIYSSAVVSNVNVIDTGSAIVLYSGLISGITISAGGILEVSSRGYALDIVSLPGASVISQPGAVVSYVY